MLELTEAITQALDSGGDGLRILGQLVIEDEPSSGEKVGRVIGIILIGLIIIGLGKWLFFPTRSDRPAASDAAKPPREQPPAGWLADPEGDGERWWDGERWTEHRRGAGSSGDAPPE